MQNCGLRDINIRPYAASFSRIKMSNESECSKVSNTVMTTSPVSIEKCEMMNILMFDNNNNEPIA